LPKNPAQRRADPLASVPRPMFCMSGRTHSASLIFCAAVRSPTVFRHDAIAPTANGMINAASNDHPTCPIAGRPASGASIARARSLDGQHAEENAAHR
jgi:hypothetical protein